MCGVVVQTHLITSQETQLEMATEDTKPITVLPQDDRLLSIKETAERLGYTYRSFSQARVERRVLLEEVRTSTGLYGHPKYRLSDVLRVIRGEIKAMTASPFTEEQKERTHERAKEAKEARSRTIGGVKP